MHSVVVHGKIRLALHVCRVSERGMELVRHVGQAGIECSTACKHGRFPIKMCLSDAWDLAGARTSICHHVVHGHAKRSIDIDSSCLLASYLASC